VRRALVFLLFAGSLFAIPGTGRANSDPFTGVAAPGGAGIGPFMRAERSPYRGAGTQYDFLPMYLYEGERLYFHSHSIGAKFGTVVTEPRFDLFLRRRFEATPYDKMPPALAGMARREPGIDAGAALQIGGAWGIAFAEWLHDVSGISRGSELRFGYRYPWRSGRLWLRPHAILNVRNAKLNDYYYGVREDEATAFRPAYSAHAGAAPELGIYAAYSLSERWRIITGYTIMRWPTTVSQSPVVDNRMQRQLTLGLMYDLTPEHEAWPEKRPLIVRVYNGDSTDCHDLLIMELRCTSTHTKDRTSVAGFEVGRPFIDRVNNWPLDVAGFVGIQRHREEGFQPDFWSVRAYVKAWYYGFPWDSKVRTRLGMGVGLSYAQKIPLMEVRDLQERSRNTSKILQTFDPTADISVGDVLGIRSLRETYVGFGVSHRSGIFGTSRLLGNVNGGSNYIYAYVETNI
jgi:MipA family protein